MPSPGHSMGAPSQFEALGAQQHQRSVTWAIQRELRSRGSLAANASHPMHFSALQGQKRAHLGSFGAQTGALGSLQVPHLFLRDRGGAEADEDDDRGSEGTEDEGEVEVVQVLEHSWSPVLLPAGRGAVNELHHHPDHTNSKPGHEAPKSTLRKASTEKSSLQTTSACSFPSPILLSQDFLCLMENHTEVHQRRIFPGKNPHFLPLPLNMEHIEHKQCKESPPNKTPPTRLCHITPKWHNNFPFMLSNGTAKKCPLQ